MNKQTYLSALENELKQRGVEDVNEIIAEYDEHFTRKTADGYSEEEIAVKLGGPKEIALQFAPAVTKAETKKSGKLVAGTGLVFADIFAGAFFILLYAWVLVLGVSAIAPAVYGLGLFIRPLLPEQLIIMPPMPYLGCLIWGVTMIAFGVLMAVLTVYSWTFAAQLGRAYRRWHKNVMSGGRYPPLAKYPTLKNTVRRKLRALALISLVALGVTFIIGYFYLAASAGALGFWHAWHWFE